MRSAATRRGWWPPWLLWGRVQLPIRWRLTFFYAALFAALLLALGLVLYRQIDRFLLDTTTARLRSQAVPVLDRHLNDLLIISAAVPGPGVLPSVPGGLHIEQPVPLPGPTFVPRELALIAHEIARELTGRETAAVVMLVDGRVVAGDRLPEQPSAPPLDPVQVQRALRRTTEVTYITAAPDGGRMMVLLLPLHRGEDDQFVGLLQLATPLQASDAVLTRLRLLLLIGLGSALGLSVVLGVPLTRAALRPLDRLVATTERIVADDLSARSRLPHGRDEIGRLAAAFDQMLARLQAGFQAQRQFVADAAHELRTPLTAISGLIELLLLGADNEDRQARRRTLVTVDKDLTRLTRLVNDLLVLSRYDLVTPAERHRVDLATLVAELHFLTAELAVEQTVTLMRPPEPVEVEGDADRLRQALLNLAENARRYTPAGGQIAFSVRSDHGMAEVTVADSGPGIAPQDLPRIFERFYRGDRARARQSGGTGLGLAIARAIAQAHGGTLTAASPPGTGAVFTLRLPLAPALVGVPSITPSSIIRAASSNL